MEYLYNFLIANDSEGPFAEEVPLSELQRGDIVQLASATGDYYHSPVVVGFSGGEILVAAHSYDAFDKRLSSYGAVITRGVHIKGVRKIVP